MSEDGQLPKYDFELDKWRRNFDKTLHDMQSGKLTSVMLVVATVDEEDVSGEVDFEGVEDSISSGVDLAIQCMIDNDIEPWCTDFAPDDDGVDFEDIDFGETAH